MINYIEKYPLLSIILFVLLFFLPNLWVFDVSIMEARNFITAREMLLDDHWLLTTMNGEPRYEKPPLPTWLTAISAYVFGITTVFGYRLPAVLMIAATGILIYLLTLHLVNDKRHAIFTAFIGMSSFYIFGITLEAPWDIYAHGFMLVTIYFLLRAFNGKSSPYIAALFLGASFLSKGPISLYALFLPFLIAYGITYKYHSKKIITVLVVLVFGLILGGWWFIYVRYADPDTFLEITARETERWSNYNVKPFYYYWNFFTQSGLWTIPAFISLLYPYLKKKVKHVQAYKFSFLWTITAVLLLSLVPEKKSRYLMPVLIPLSITTGFYINFLVRSFKKVTNKYETIPVYINFGLMSLIGIGFPIGSYLIFKNHVAEHWILYGTSSLAFLLTGIALLIYLIKKEIVPVFFLSILIYALLFLTVVPFLKYTISDNYNPISKLNINFLQKDIELYSYGIAPEFIWHYGEQIPKISETNTISGELASKNKFGLLTPNINVDELKSLKIHFEIDSITTFNLNRTALNSKKQNKRLIATYYILTKK